MQRMWHLGFDLMFRPFAEISPIYALLVFSAITGVLISLVFRFASNRAAIRLAKDSMQASVLGVRLFQDQLDVSLGCYASLFGGVARYLWCALLPAAISFIPLLIIFCQLQMCMEWRAPRAGENFLLTARAKDEASLQPLSIELPTGLALSAPPVQAPEKREISWRIRADQSGHFTASILTAAGAFTKTVYTGDAQPRLSPARNTSLVHSLLSTDESTLPVEGPLEAIEVRYEPRELQWSSFRLDWKILFVVFSFLSALVSRPLIGAEF